jgi:hypothetical protein
VLLAVAPGGAASIRAAAAAAHTQIPCVVTRRLISHQPLTMSLNECATPAASGPLHSHPFHLTAGESGPRAPPPPVKSRRRSFCERKLNEEKNATTSASINESVCCFWLVLRVHVYERLCAAGAHPVTLFCALVACGIFGGARNGSIGAVYEK